MIRNVAIPLCAALVAALAAFAAASPAQAGERIVRLFTWSDYFDADVIAAFETRHDCILAVDYFDSNETMYAKLTTNAVQYDLITPSSYMSAIMRRRGMLMPVDHALLPNLRHLDADFALLTEDPGMEYGIPYTRTVTGVGFNADRVNGGDLGSWSIFSSSAYAGRMTMLNDMRETIGAALKYLGYSLNTVNEKELDAAGAVLAGWKKQLARFDVDEAKIDLASGELLVVHAYNGDAAVIMEENPDIEFFIPKEGSSLASDEFVIPVGAHNADLAHAFINHMLDPDMAAMNMESIGYFMPNPDALELISEELRNNSAFKVDDDILKRCEVIRDLGPKNSLYVRIWDRVKGSN